MKIPTICKYLWTNLTPLNKLGMFFNSKFPIVLAPMNKGINLDLALAVHRAGGFACLTSYCYYDNLKPRLNEFVLDLYKFVKLANSPDLLLAIDYIDLMNPTIQKTINELEISHLLCYADHELGSLTRTNVEQIGLSLLKSFPGKILHLLYDLGHIPENCDAYLIKGSNGAGRPGESTTWEMFTRLKDMNLGKVIIPMGGIGTAAQVKEYIDAGAAAVAIGTLFAATSESALSIEAKQALVKASRLDLTELEPHLKQKTLILDKEHLTFDPKDPNNTAELEKGIQGNGSRGIIFAGDAVDHVEKILTVQEVMNNLTELLPKEEK